MKKLFALKLGLFAPLIAILFLAPRPMQAQDHVVAPSVLQKDLTNASAARQENEKNEKKLEQFVSSPEAQGALKTAHIDGGQVKNAIPQLGDEDLAQMSARAEKAQKDFAAGRLSDRDLIIIILCIAALVLIIVAVR